MSSAAQLAANQTNATHSTGPVSETGKAASSRNNLRHGFRSQTVLLPGDDPAEYEALLAELTEHLSPQDLTDTRFVREMADADWRLRRVRQQLESALVRQMDSLAPTHPGLPVPELQSIAVETLSQTGTAYGTWLRYETKLERQYDRAFKNWTSYQQLSRKEAVREADLAIKNMLFAPLPNQLPDDAPPVKLASNVQNVLIPRSADCPCGSRQKYKRCCGRSAPPVPGFAKAA